MVVPVRNVDTVTFSYADPTLTINWSGVASTLVLLRYRPADGDWTDEIAIYAPIYTYAINGLTKGRQYEFEFVTKSGAFTTAKTYFSYIIPSGMPGPLNVSFDEMGNEYVKIYFEGDAAVYHIVWTAAGEPLHMMKITKDAAPIEILITGLKASLPYSFKVYREYQDEEILMTEKYLERPANCGNCVKQVSTTTTTSTTVLPPTTTTTTTTTTSTTTLTTILP